MVSQSMSNQDFLQPLLDLMQKNADRQDERMDRLDAKLEANTTLTNKIHEQTKKTNGRVNKHDDQIADLISKINRAIPDSQKPIPKDLAPWYRDPLILKIVLYISLGILLVVGAITGVNIGGLL